MAQAFEYLVRGGLANTEHLLRFVADTVLYQGFGFDPPAEVAATGVYRSSPAAAGTLVAVVFYRAHLIVGNTTFVDDLCDAIEARGARALAIWCYSLRPAAGGRIAAIDLLAEYQPDAVITTVLASGSADPDGGDWDATSLAALGVPIVQAIAATCPRADWEANPGGLFPIDVAMSVAIPEFDGRIITVPFSFKETVDDGDTLGTPVTAYRSVADRVARVAGVALRLAGLRRVPVADRRVAIVLSAYPTKRSRIGNAVALDTPASVIALLHELRAEGYRVDRIPDDGDSLMAELIDAFSYERETLTGAQLARAAGRWPAASYRQAFARMPPGLTGRSGGEMGPRAGDGVRRRRQRRPRVRGHRPGPRVHRGAAAPRLRRRPHRGLPLARSRPDPPLPGVLPLAGRGVGCRRHRARRQARDPRMAARQRGGAVVVVRARRRPRRHAPDLPVRRQRPGRGHAGQAAGPCRHHRPLAAADDTGGDL